MNQKKNDSQLSREKNLSDFKHTPEQKRIIDAGVGNLLVSAAAGSGKTAVLTDRIVSRLVSGEADIRQLLVMTFTDAAAGEMKTRIEKKLYAALSSETSREKRQWLSRQISWLPGASVSTIHGFCLRVIKDFVHLLKDDQDQPLLDASFSVDDGIEAELLLEQSLELYLRQLYEQIDQIADTQGESGGARPEQQAASTQRAPAAGANIKRTNRTGSAYDLPGYADSLKAFKKLVILKVSGTGQMTGEWIAAFNRLMDGFGGSRTDQPVRDLIIRQYHYLRSLPDYQELISRELFELEQAAASFSASEYARSLFTMLRLRLERALPAVKEIQQILKSGQSVRFIADPDRNQRYLEQYQRLFAQIRHLEAILEQPEPRWDAVVKIGRGWEDLSLPRANRHDQPEKTAVMSLFNQSVAELVYFVSGACRTDKYQQHFVFDSKPVFTVTEAQICQDIYDMLPAIQIFYSLILGLDEAYTQSKKAQGFIDFADFEHLALSLLRFDEVKQYYLDKYQEIYVDEYQDTSSIQEAVIQAVSQGNCLMVGDLKQSIYRFRHARPQIFKTKAERFSQTEEGSLIELNRNFRSVENLLLTINQVFEQLMSLGAGEIDYDEHQALIPHRRQENSSEKAAHLLILNTVEADQDLPEVKDRRDWEDSDDELSDNDDPVFDRKTIKEQSWEMMSVYEKEAAMAAAEIIRLRKEKSASWSDFALLCRTRNIMQAAAAVLQEMGLPVLEGSDAQRFDIPELRLIEAMIHLCDNAGQDIPLAAVMRSNLFRIHFSDDDLAKIRVEAREARKEINRSVSRSEYFHQAVNWYRENGKDRELAEKLNQFYKQLDEWRQRAVYMRVDEWLRLLISRTQLISRLSAGRQGAFKTHIITRLVSLASLFEHHQRRGLHQFARNLENLRLKDKLGSFFSQETQETEGIRVMTIHGSKGLEFPVVFLIGSQYGIVPREPQESLLISENIGIGFDYVDPERRIRYLSHPKLAMLADTKASGMAEELRLLYVALTRARDQLYITAANSLQTSAKRDRFESLISQAQQVTSRTLPDHLVLSCKSYLEWLVLVFARGCEADAFMNPGLETKQDMNKDSRWEIRHVSWETLIQTLDNPYSEAADQNLDSQSVKQALSAHTNADTESRAEIKQSELRLTGFDQSESAVKDFSDQLKQRITTAYRYSPATRAPVKLAVSELKRLEQQHHDEEPPGTEGYQWLNQSWQSQKGPDIYDLRGINQTLQISDLQSVNQLQAPSGIAPARQKAGGAAIGTLLHHVFRYLNLPELHAEDGPAALERHLVQMLKQSLLSEEEYAALRQWQPDIGAFIGSDLAAEMRQASLNRESVLYQEMPFTLAVPVQEVYPEGEGFAQSDRVLVQGMIDCWFRKGSEITLVDFKSDEISGSEALISQVLRQRYSLQLKWYAKALEASLGQSPGRCLIWHIRSRKAYLIQTR